MNRRTTGRGQANQKDYSIFILEGVESNVCDDAERHICKEFGQAFPRKFHDGDDMSEEDNCRSFSKEAYEECIIPIRYWVLSHCLSGE